MDAELARGAAVAACLGLAVVVAAPWRRARLAGLLAVAGGGLALLAFVAPLTGGTLGPAVAASVVAGVPAAALLLRWPWLSAAGALAFVPARIPVALDGEDANLLLPLYGVVAAAALALAWQLLRGDGRARELGPLAWPVAALVTWIGLTAVWTEDLDGAAVELVAFYLPFGLLAVVLARLPWSRRWLTVLGVQLALMAVVFAGIGLYQWLTRDVFWNPKVIVGNAYAPFYRVNSVFWDPSIYGRFLVLAIVAALVVVLARVAWRAALAAAAVVAVAWIGLVLSFSQSSFAALMVVVVAAAAVAWGRRAVVALATIAVLAVSVGFSSPQVRHEIQRDLDRATSGRAGLVTNGIRIARDNPVLGVGLASFEPAYAARVGLRGEEPRRAASHNTPVTVVAEAGIPGLALLVWLLVVGIGGPLRAASRSLAGRVSLIVALSLLALAVHSLFYNALFEDPMTWGYLGLGALVLRRGEPPA